MPRSVAPAVAVLAVLAAPVFAKAPSPLQAQLERELAGNTFETRIPLGSAWRYYNNGAQREFLRRIDTEVSPDGNVRYLCLKGDFNLDGSPLLSGWLDHNFYVEPQKMVQIPAGSRVAVEKVQMMDDRLELQLSGPGGQYAKIKFAMGKGFQTGQTYGSLMATITRAVRVESYERIQRLESERANLAVALTEARAAYETSAGADAKERLEAAQALRRALEEAKHNADQLAAQGQGSAAGPQDAYAPELAQLSGAIDDLKEAAGKERVTEIERAIDTDATELATLRRRLQVKAAGLREWRDSQAAAERADQILDHRKALLDERGDAGRPATREELGRLEQDRQWAKNTLATLRSQGPAFEGARLQDEYRGMEKELHTHQDTYTAAFGTARQAAEAENLLALLDQMYRNRAAAQRAGVAGAAAQAETLSAEIDRTKRQQRR